MPLAAGLVRGFNVDCLDKFPQRIGVSSSKSSYLRTRWINCSKFSICRSCTSISCCKVWISTLRCAPACRASNMPPKTARNGKSPVPRSIRSTGLMLLGAHGAGHFAFWGRCLQTENYLSQQVFLSSSVIARMTLQGLPTATESLGISLTTTLPPPMTTLLPSVTPGIT